MKRTSLFTTLLISLLSMPVPGLAQRMHHDPLTKNEADQLRETATEPVKRMHLLVKFTRARMEALDKIRSDQKLAEVSGENVRSLLENIAQLVDEIDDNLSSYNARSADLRKPLKEVIEADSDFQLKLRILKETASVEALQTYGFTIEQAMDSVNASADSARAMLDGQNASRGKDKSKNKDTTDNDNRIRQQIEKRQQNKRCPPPC